MNTGLKQSLLGPVFRQELAVLDGTPVDREVKKTFRMEVIGSRRWVFRFCAVGCL